MNPILTFEIVRREEVARLRDLELRRRSAERSAPEAPRPEREHHRGARRRVRVA